MLVSVFITKTQISGTERLFSYTLLLLKKNLFQIFYSIIDMRKSINLIQDFDMPAVSTSVKMSRDGQYCLTTGIYKPRVKCFDVNQLSIKFERCFDAEAVTFEILSDDYSKVSN